MSLSTDGIWSPSFSEWATNTRTAALIKRCVNAEKMYQDQAFNNTLLQNKVNDLESQLKRHESVSHYNGLDIEQWRTRAIEAESEIANLRGELEHQRTIKNLIIDIAGVRYRKIAKLQETIKTNDEFIDLQTKRLAKARNMIMRICLAAGLHAPDESSLDP